MSRSTVGNGVIAFREVQMNSSKVLGSTMLSNCNVRLIPSEKRKCRCSISMVPPEAPDIIQTQ